jgi:hypothetical protein
MTGRLVTMPASASAAAFNIPQTGVIPVTLVDGDIWWNNFTGVLNYRSGGTPRIFADTDHVADAIATKIVNKLTVASTAPSSPSTNDVWIDTT